MMAISVKTFLWGLGSLVALLWAVFQGKSPWKDRAEKAQDAATQAHHDAIDTKADAAKEANDHAAEMEHADLDSMSDADLFNDALDRVRPERSGD